MTASIDQTLHQFANLLPNWTLIPILTLLPNFEGFHRTLQRVRLANRGRLLLRTPGPVPFGTDTSRYLDDIFTIDNPEFEKYIPDIYPAELQLNKANTSDKETSFLDLNIKVIGSDIHTSVYDKRDDFGFPIVNFPWLSGDVPRLPSYGIYISQLVRFARCCTSVLDFHSKNLQITSKLLTQGYRYHKLRKTFGKFFRSYSELLSKFGDISFQEYVFKGISHPVFYGDLVYKLRRVKDTPNFISSASKIVKRLRRRQYDPLIIETTIGLVLGPCTALCRLFLKHCTLTNKAVGTI